MSFDFKSGLNRPQNSQLEEPDTYEVNRAVGNYPGVGIVPFNQFSYWAVIICIVFGACFLLDGTPLTFGMDRALFVSAVLCLSCWFLTGKREHQFWDRFSAFGVFQTTWDLARVPFRLCKAGFPIKARLGKIGAWWKRLWGGKEIVREALEDLIDLQTYGQIDYKGFSVGFYLLQKSPVAPLRFVFCWQIFPPHATINEKAAKMRVTDWEKGLRCFPRGEEWTFDSWSFQEDKNQLKNLENLYASWRSSQPRNRLAEALILSQRDKLRELTATNEAKGFVPVRKVKQTFFYATVTPDRAFWEEQDLISNILRSATRLVKNLGAFFLGRQKELSYEELLGQIELAFKGFVHYQNILTNTMHLNVEPMSAEANWRRDNSEYRLEEPPPLPYYLHWNGKRAKIFGSCQTVHIATALFQGERGRAVFPKRNPAWVYLQRRKKYVGFMQLGRVTRGHQEIATDVVRHLWEIIIKEPAYDSRTVVQFSSENRKMQKFMLERATRNAICVGEESLKRKNIDVEATRRAKDSVRAQNFIVKGGSVLKVGAGIFLYRNSPRDLDRDFADLADLFPGMEPSPYRERYVSDKIWLSILPYVDRAFLKNNFDRTDLYLSKDSPWLLPLVSTNPVDSSGLELVALEGGTPIYLNPYDPSRHFRFMIIAEPRSGKSVQVSDYIVGAWLRRQPVVVFDVPRIDGSSTYTDVVNLIKSDGGRAAYYDIGSKSNNLLHLYDFSHLADAEIRHRVQQELRQQVTVTIGMGDLQDPKLEDAMRNIVTLSLAAFDNKDSIRSRFKAANRDGVGTEAWRDSPTYHDYLFFLKQTWIEQYFLENELSLPSWYREAAGMLVQKLESVLQPNNKLCNAIARASDFDFSSLDILVFALAGSYSDYEIRILSQAGYATLVIRSLTALVCHFLVDESPQLMKYEAFAKNVGNLSTNGPKWGVRVGIISQFPKVVFESAGGDDIAQTINVILVGHIKEQVIPDLVKYLGYDSELLYACADESFKPSGTALRSHWLLKVYDRYTFCGHYPSDLLLALTANDLPEARARERYKKYYKKYRDDELLGALAFTKDYIPARKSRTAMSELDPERSDPWRDRQKA